MVIFNQDTKYLRDKHENELRLTQTRNSRTIAVLVGIIIMMSAVFTVYLLRKGIRKREEERQIAEARSRALADEKARLEREMTRYKENYARLEQERDELSEMLSSNPPADRQCMRVLNDRLELLNRFFAAAISGNEETDRIASHEPDRLVADRDMFLYTTRMTFAAAHPDFISYLELKD